MAASAEGVAKKKRKVKSVKAAPVEEEVVKKKKKSVKKKKLAPAAAAAEAAAASPAATKVAKKKKASVKKAAPKAAKAATSTKSKKRKIVQTEDEPEPEIQEEVAPAKKASKKVVKKKATPAKKKKVVKKKKPSATAADEASSESESDEKETRQSVSSFAPAALEAPAAAVKRNVAKAERAKRREAGKAEAKAKDTEEVVVVSRTKKKPTEQGDRAELGVGAVPGRGVIYLGHIPHGFYEQQMRGYFEQFGDITRLRLARNKKTGASRHFAFVEFADEEVAMIVADTMHNYLLDNKLIVCQMVEPSKLHPNTFDGCNRTFRKIPWREIAMERHNQDRTAVQQRNRVRGLAARDKKKRAKLAKAGIEYDFPGYGDGVVAKATSIKFD